METPSTPEQDELNARLDAIRAELQQSQNQRWEEQHNTRRRYLPRAARMKSDSVFRDRPE